MNTTAIKCGDLFVKCLCGCGFTATETNPIYIAMESVENPAEAFAESGFHRYRTADEFLGYKVMFDPPMHPGVHGPISVRGEITSENNDTYVFALPYLTSQGNGWQSHEDRDGAHFAIKLVER